MFTYITLAIVATTSLWAGIDAHRYKIPSGGSLVGIAPGTGINGADQRTPAYARFRVAVGIAHRVLAERSFA